MKVLERWQRNLSQLPADLSVYVTSHVLMSVAPHSDLPLAEGLQCRIVNIFVSWLYFLFFYHQYCVLVFGQSTSGTDFQVLLRVQTHTWRDWMQLQCVGWCVIKTVIIKCTEELLLACSSHSFALLLAMLAILSICTWYHWLCVKYELISRQSQWLRGLRYGWTVFACSDTGVMGSNPTWGMEVYFYSVFVLSCVGGSSDMRASSICKITILVMVQFI
jgi:hypothetical protein